MRKGISPLISYTIVIGIMLTAIGMAVTIGLPIIEEMRDTAAIESAIGTLTELDNVIQTVASGGKFTTRSFTIRNDRGRFHYDPDENSIYYEIESNSEIISTHSSRQIGPVILSANRDVTVSNSTINGTNCWMMENDHLQACIRQIDRNWNADRHGNLVGYWRMNEGEDQNVSDTSTSNNHGTLGNNTTTETSDPTWVDGIEGNALEFDGNEDYVEIAGAESLNPQEEVSLSFWMKPDTVSPSAIMRTFQRFSGIYGSFVATDGLLHFYVDTTDNGGSWESAHYQLPSPDRWYHVVGTYNRTSVNLYVDGDLKNLDPQSNDIESAGSQNAYIGRHSSDIEHFDGLLDEVRLYDRALSAGEVEWLYHQRGDLDYINNSQLLLYYYNKDLDRELTPEVSVLVNGLNSTIAGDGYTTAEDTGSVARGRVTANIESEHGFTYDLHFDLLSSSDFLKIDVE